MNKETCLAKLYHFVCYCIPTNVLGLLFIETIKWKTNLNNKKLMNNDQLNSIIAEFYICIATYCLYFLFIIPCELYALY